MDRITEFYEKLEALNSLSDGDLAVLESEGLSLFDAVKAGDIEVEDKVQTIRELHAKIAAIQAEAAERIDAAEKVNAEIAEIEADLQRPDVPETPEGVTDAEQTPDAADASKAETAPEPEADPETAPVAETPPEPAPAPAPAPEAEPEPVTAAAPRPDLSALRSHQPPPVRTIEAAAPETPAAFLTGPGDEIVTDLFRADELLVRAHAAVSAAPGMSAKTPVLRRRLEYPDQMLLQPGDSVGNRRKVDAMIAAAIEQNAEYGGIGGFTAAGQFCAEAEPWYGQPVLGDTDRPLRDSLAGMGLTRGSISVSPSPVLSDIVVDDTSGAIDTLDPCSATSDKTVQTFTTCPTPITTCLEATSVRLKFTNWDQLTWQERIDAYTSLSMVSAARHREQRLLTLMDALCTAVTYNGGTLGLDAYSDILFALNDLVSAERDRLRVGANYPFHVWAPRRMINLMQAGLARQMPGDGFGRYRRSEADIRGDLAALGINLTLLWDDEVPAAQGAGGLQVFDATVQLRVAPEGTFMFGGGQEINLGVIHDSANNDTNTFETFEERFETLFRVGGWPAYLLTITACPNGATAGTVDTSGACSGS